MNARVPPAKMEAPVQTMLTLTLAPVHLASLASTVKSTSLTALKGLCVFEFCGCLRFYC